MNLLHTLLGITRVDATSTQGIPDYVPLTPDSQLLFGNIGGGFSSFVGNIYISIITIAIVLSVGLFIYHAFRYSVSDLLPTKKSAKEALYNVLIGLGLILSAYLILYSINPAIVSFDLGVYQGLVDKAEDRFRLVKCSTVRSGMTGEEQVPTREGVFLKRIYWCDKNNGVGPENGGNLLSYEYIESYEEIVRKAMAAAGQDPTSTDPSQYIFNLNQSNNPDFSALNSTLCEEKARALNQQGGTAREAYLTNASCAYKLQLYTYQGILRVSFPDINYGAMYNWGGQYLRFGVFQQGMIFDDKYSNADEGNNWTSNWIWKGKNITYPFQAPWNNAGTTLANCNRYKAEINNNIRLAVRVVQAEYAQQKRPILPAHTVRAKGSDYWTIDFTEWWEKAWDKITANIDGECAFKTQSTRNF